jgi:hypothetical protein
MHASTHRRRGHLRWSCSACASADLVRLLNYLRGFGSFPPAVGTPIASLYASSRLGLLIALFTIEQLVNGCATALTCRAAEDDGPSRGRRPADGARP